MIDFEKIIKESGKTKRQIANEIFAMNEANVNRKLKSYSKNLSEIDKFLRQLGTSLSEVLGADYTKDELSRSISELTRAIEKLTAKNS